MKISCFFHENFQKHFFWKKRIFLNNTRPWVKLFLIYKTKKKRFFLPKDAHRIGFVLIDKKMKKTYAFIKHAEMWAKYYLSFKISRRLVRMFVKKVNNFCHIKNIVLSVLKWKNRVVILKLTAKNKRKLMSFLQLKWHFATLISEIVKQKFVWVIKCSALLNIF